MHFNINYTNSRHDEMLYITHDLHIAVLRFDTNRNLAKVVYYKQLDKVLDLISTSTSVSYRGSFLISMEPVTQDGVEGYLDAGKSFQVCYISVSARRAFAHVLELSKDPETEEFRLKVNISTPVMESILKLRYNLKDSQMFNINQETGQKSLKPEFLTKYIDTLDWHEDVTSLVKFKHPGNYFRPGEKVRYVYFEFFSNFSFNKYKITTYRLYLNTGFIKRISIHFSQGVRLRNQNNIIFRNETSKKWMSHHIYQKIGAHVVRNVDPDQSDNSSESEVSREFHLSSYNLVTAQRVKTIKINYDPRKLTGEYKELSKEFYRATLEKISNFIYFQDSEKAGMVQIIGNYRETKMLEDDLLFDRVQLEPAFMYVDLVLSYAEIKYKQSQKNNKEPINHDRIVTIEKQSKVDLDEIQKNYFLSSTGSWIV